jgi:hypothetical protein
MSYSTFPERVWEQTTAGKWASREATEADRERRKEAREKLRNGHHAHAS